MLVVAVPDGAQRQRRFGVGKGHVLAVVFGGERAGHLERCQRVAGVAFRPVDQVVERVGVDGEVGVAEAALAVGQRALEQRADVVGLERVEPEQRGSRQQWPGQGEVRVLRRRADEDDEALLDVREQRVLLGAVEAVHLVEEEDRALPVLPEPIARSVDDLANILDARAHRRQRLERLGGDAGDEPGDRGLARAGRSPQHDRRQAVALDEDPQRTPRPEQVLLPDDLVQRARPQPCRQRRALVQPLIARRREQILAHGLSLRPLSPKQAHALCFCDNAAPTISTACASVIVDVNRSTFQPATTKSFARTRSSSNALRVRWCSQPSISMASRPRGAPAPTWGAVTAPRCSASSTPPARSAAS